MPQAIVKDLNCREHGDCKFFYILRRVIIVCCLGWIITTATYAQNRDTVATVQDTTRKPGCEQKDMSDYLRQWFKMEPRAQNKTSSIFLVPVVGSTPSTGVLVGVTLQTAFQLPESKMSAFQATVQYTFNKQFSVSVKNNVFAKKNKVFLSGDWTYYDYSQPTYGLGTNAPGRKLKRHFVFSQVGETKDTLAQPMKFKHYKLHQTISFKVFRNFFVGPGIHYDRYDKIQDLTLDTLNHQITSHYAYSMLYGFDPTRYSVMGVSLNLVFDSRDNLINAYKGFYANINYRMNPEFLGSDKASSTLWTEFRSYLSMSKRRPQKVLAFWWAGHFTVNGTLPYLNLPAVGNDQRSKTGRGYTIARFRGNHMMYGEVEYRFPLLKCSNILGGVVFANAVTTTNQDKGVKLFEYIRPSVGLGLRILFQKQSRMNIQVDYAQGEDSNGVYFGASEVF